MSYRGKLSFLINMNLYVAANLKVVFRRQIQSKKICKRIRTTSLIKRVPALKGALMRAEDAIFLNRSTQIDEV